MGALALCYQLAPPASRGLRRPWSRARLPMVERRVTGTRTLVVDCPIWKKFRRLVQNDMSTAVIWSKLKPEVEFQYGGRFGEFNGMSSQSHVSRCRVGLLPLGEFTVMIPEPHATLQCAVTWRNQCNTISSFKSDLKTYYFRRHMDN